MGREIKTNSGHVLTFREAKFIEYLVAGKSEREAVLMAGFSANNATKYAKTLMNKDYIADELDYRYQKAKEANIADATEILTYYTEVMRGLVKDQFGLDAPLTERTKAANELAKRLIDYQREAEMADKSQNINIVLNWDRKGDDNDVEES